jgi:glucokinase
MNYSMPQSQCSLAVGIDIGGTTSRAALVDELNAIVDSVRCPTPEQPDILLAWIANTCGAWAATNKISIPVGLALPGVVNTVNGAMMRSVNLPWLEGKPLVDQLEKQIGIRPRLMTDAEAATWGEFVDAGSPVAPFAHLRLGTGVACGVVVDGKLIPTDATRKTHWPLLVVDGGEDAPICACGLRGCLEIFAGGGALSRKAGDLGFRDLPDLSRSFESNHEAAVALIDGAATAISLAVSNLAREFGATLVNVGGGVIVAIPQLFTRIHVALTESGQLAVPIAPSRLGDDAGVIGAARLACRMKAPI